MRHPYHTACSYAYALNRELYKDYVHSAWMNHFNRTGACLFDQATPYILTAVKFVHKRHQQDFYFEWRRKKYLKQWYSIDEETFPISTNTPNPLALTESEEFITEFNEVLNNYRSNNPSGMEIGEQLKEFVRLKEQGYSQVEIAEEMGMSPQRINFYSKKIKQLVSNIHNPLRTSLVPISERISRKEYETNEQYRAFKYDAETCDSNEFYEILTDGKTFILVREKEE